jgi:cold shock CspA family protein
MSLFEATSNLSSSFPGASKTIQLYQLQKRHLGKVDHGDQQEDFINCNPAAAAPCQETGDSRERGIVKWYSGRKHYGFITNLNNQYDHFVHQEDLNPQKCITPMLYTGEYVEYNTVHTKDGRIKACNVMGVDEGPLMCDHGMRPTTVGDDLHKDLQ